MTGDSESYHRSTTQTCFNPDRKIEFVSNIYSSTSNLRRVGFESHKTPTLLLDPNSPPTLIHSHLDLYLNSNLKNIREHVSLTLYNSTQALTRIPNSSPNFEDLLRFEYSIILLLIKTNITFEFKYFWTNLILKNLFLDDFGLLLEDDIEVSSYYYLWIKYTLLACYYDPQVSLPQLSSISLYTPRLIEVLKGRPQWNATNFFKNIHSNTPYLQQLPCSWGAVFFPKHWRELYWYMNARVKEDPMLNRVQIPESVSNGWRESWKRFLIDMMYIHGYVTLYPNFPDQASFSTNHMEPGVHIGAKNNTVRHRKEDYEVPLLDDEFWYLLPNGKLPPAYRLPSLDLFNQATSLIGLKLAGAKLGIDVLKCNVSEIVIVDHLTGLPKSCVQFY